MEVVDGYHHVVTHTRDRIHIRKAQLMDLVSESLYYQNHDFRGGYCRKKWSKKTEYGGVCDPNALVCAPRLQIDRVVFACCDDPSDDRAKDTSKAFTLLFFTA